MTRINKLPETLTRHTADQLYAAEHGVPRTPEEVSRFHAKHGRTIVPDEPFEEPSSLTAEDLDKLENTFRLLCKVDTYKIWRKKRNALKASMKWQAASTELDAEWHILQDQERNHTLPVGIPPHMSLEAHLAREALLLSDGE